MLEFDKVASKFLISSTVSLHFISILFVALIATTSTAWSEEKAKDHYVLGVFPHLPPRELEKVYAPISADLSQAVGRQVRFRSSSTYANFMERLETEDFDIIFAQPFDYVRAADKHGYLPMATRDEPLATIVVVKKGSPIRQSLSRPRSLPSVTC